MQIQHLKNAKLSYLMGNQNLRILLPRSVFYNSSVTQPFDAEATIFAYL